MRRIILVFSFILLASASHAQWRLLRQFGPTYDSDFFGILSTGPKLSAYPGLNGSGLGIVEPTARSGVEAVHFLTREGAPNVGFVSVLPFGMPDPGSGQIWRTSDAGNTWTKVFEDGSTQRIFNFSFESPLIGYAGEETGMFRDRYLKTTDGGLSWSHVATPTSISSWTKVYYFPSTHRFFLLGIGVLMSSNDGATWNDVDPGGWAYGGIAFANDTLGYLTGYYHNYITTNGGLNWSILNTPTIYSFQPDGASPTTFFDMSSRFASEDTQKVSRSLDGGRHWTTLPTPNIGYMTSDIEGTYKRLYIIGSTGVATSTDSGTSWRRICGPTNYNQDGIHFVRGDTMYTGDFLYGLWMNPTGQDSDIRYPLLAGGVCDPDSCKDVIAYFGLYNGNSCSSVTVTHYHFFGSNRFTLLSDTSQHHGPIGQSDTLSFLYDPYGTGRDTLSVEIQYSIGTDVHLDTFYLIGVRKDPLTYTMSIQSQESLLANGCDSNITIASVTNTSCDTLYVTGIHLTNGKYFSVDTISETLLPGALIQIRAVGKALQNGLYRDTIILKVERGSTILTLQFPIYFRLTNAFFIQASGFQLNRNLSCSLLDTILVVKNVYCDTLSLNGIKLSGSTVFSTSDSNLIAKIVPGATLNIPLRIRLDIPGTFSASMRLHLTVRGQSVDTIITISLTISTHNSLSASQPVASFINLCALKDFWIKLNNSACDTLFVTSLQVSGQVGLDTTLHFPLSILPDSSISLPVNPIAFAKGQYNGNVSLNYLSHGIKYDTSLQVQYSVLNNVFPLSVRQTVASFLDSCALKDFQVILKNPTCDTLFVTSLQPSGEVSLDTTLQFPLSIPPDSSLSLPVTPIVFTKGQYLGDMALNYLSHGTQYDTLLQVQYTVANNVSPRASLSAGRIRMPNSTLCGSFDTTIFFTNSSCRAIEWTTADWSVPLSDFSIVSAPVLPILLTSGETDSIHIHYVPQAAGTRTAELQLGFSLDSRMLDTEIQISGNVVSSALYAPDMVDIGSVPDCEASAEEMWIANLACDSVKLLSLIASDSSIEIISPSAGSWIQSRDSVEVLFQVRSKQIGNYSARINISDSDKDGIAAVTIPIEGSIVSSVLDVQLEPTALSMPLVAPCVSHFDTITVVNRSPCDSLRISSASLTEASPSIVLDAGSLPRVLLPGDSVRLFISVLLSPDTSISDTCIITGDSMLEVGISASSGGAASILSLPERSLTLSPPVCSTTSAELHFSNGGCATIVVDSAELSNFLPLSGFSLPSGVQYPIVLSPGSNDSIEVAFDAETRDTAHATLYLWSNGVNSLDSIVMTGFGIGEQRTMRMSVLADGASMVSADPGSNISLGLSFRDSLPSGQGLNSVGLRLYYNTDLLTASDFAPKNGWSVQSQTAPAQGMLDLVFSRTNPDDSIAASENIGDLPCRVTVTKDSSTLITLDGIQFNDGDSNYARCTLASVNPGDTAYFTLNPFCGDFLFEQVLGVNGMIELFEIEKSADGQGIFADFRLASNAHVKLEVFNERGGLLNVAFERDLSRGSYIVTLALANEGAFFLSLNAGTETLIRKLAMVR